MQKTSVLCVEDEEDFRTGLLEFLTQEGYVAHSAADGQEGLRQILEHKPALVLCDVSMPKMTGFQLLTELRAFHPQQADIPFIFLTALNQKKDMLTGRLLGADDYVTKPVDFDALAVLIKSRIDQAARQRRRGESEISSFKSLLLQMLASEMRMPIHALLGQSELMREKLRESKNMEGIVRLAASMAYHSQSLLAMLNNAADATAITSGVISLQPQPVDGEALLWECIQAFQGAGGQESFKISHAVDPQMPSLRADPWLLARAFLAILQETARSNPEGGILLELAMKDGRPLIAFRDAYLPAGEGEETPLVKGGKPSPICGISLQFVRAVMEAHGGEVRLHERQNQVVGVDLLFPREDALGAAA